MGGKLLVELCWSLFPSFHRAMSVNLLVQIYFTLKEFARSGVQEVAKPIEIMRPHPEHVLKKFQRGIQCENVLSELFAKVHKSLPENVLASEVGEQFEEHIELHTGIAENLKFRGQQERKYSSCEPLNDHEGDTKFHGAPYERQGVREKTSEFYEWASSKRTTPLTPIRTENERVHTNLFILYLCASSLKLDYSYISFILLRQNEQIFILQCYLFFSLADIFYIILF